MRKIIFLLAALMALPATGMAWDGYDWDRGSYVEIDKGNLVRTGNEIEIYDWGEGQYKDVEILGNYDNGNSVDIEVMDGDENRTFDMDK